MDRPFNKPETGSLGASLRKKVFAIGATNMDICAKSQKPILDADSNIGTVSTACGGVGRNIAVALGYLGFDVEFLTAIANDHFGHILKNSLEDCGVKAVAPLLECDDAKCDVVCDGKTTAQSDGIRSGVYSYILDSNGTLLCGINDMGVNETLTPDVIDGYENALNAADYVVFEANIPQKTIVGLARYAKQGVKLVADCVSATKCTKLLDVLGDLYLLKANYSEACTLAGMDDSGAKDPLAVAQRLAGKGLVMGVITLGKDGAFCFKVHAFEDGGLEWYRVEPPRDCMVVNTNGCGDVFLAGFLSALSKGLELKDALSFGQKAASVNATSGEAVSKELLSFA